MTMPGDSDNFAQQNLARTVEAKGKSVGHAATDQHLCFALPEA